MRKFKVGEEVTVRAWEDMKKQYGVKTFAVEMPKDQFLGSILNKLVSANIIFVPNGVVTDVMKPFCGRKMRISANPALNIYELEGAEPFKWSAEAFEEFWKEEEPESTEVEKEKMGMPKLENGMVVELRNGERYLIAEFSGEQFLLSNKHWLGLKNMDLKTGKGGIPAFDIVKVIKPHCPDALKAIKRSERIIWEAE